MHFSFSNINKILSSKSLKDEQRLRELSKASIHLYTQTNPYLIYRILNRLIRQCSIKPAIELFIFVSLKHKASLKHLLKQLLITSSPHLVQQLIYFQYNPQKKLDFYLPKSMLDILAQNQVIIDKRTSLIKLFTTSCFRWFEGLKLFFQLLKQKENSTHNFSCSIYGMPINAIPVKGSYTFLHWFDKESKYKNHLNSYRIVTNQNLTKRVTFEKKIEITPYIFPSYSSFLQKLFFFLSGFFYFIIALIFLLLGRYQLALLSKEILLYRYFLKLKQQQKSSCYLFFCHSLGFRPLWTYQAEYEKRDVLNIFYASSYTLFHYNNKDVPSDVKLPYVQIASWSHYWVQSKEFKETLLSLFENPSKIDVVEPFPFIDEGIPIPLLKENEIIIFDVDPSSDYLEYTKHGYIIPYLNEDIVCKFWIDLYQVAKELNLVLVHKKKRNNELKESRYTVLLKKMEEEGTHYKKISGFLNTFELLKKNPKKTSISIPFTSTGEMAKNLGLNAIYYDSSGSLSNPQKHTRGVVFICGISKLKNYLRG